MRSSRARATHARRVALSSRARCSPPLGTLRHASSERVVVVVVVSLNCRASPSVPSRAVGRHRDRARPPRADPGGRLRRGHAGASRAVLFCSVPFVRSFVRSFIRSFAPTPACLPRGVLMSARRREWWAGGGVETKGRLCRGGVGGARANKKRSGMVARCPTTSPLLPSDLRRKRAT